MKLQALGSLLYSWTCSQRQSYKQSELSQRRIDLLEEIGFSWKMKSYDRHSTKRYLDNWNATYEKLVAYKEEVRLIFTFFSGFVTSLT
jgi:hypothetical protein